MAISYIVESGEDFLHFKGITKNIFFSRKSILF